MKDDPRTGEQIQAASWQPIKTAPKGGGADDVRDPKYVQPPRILAFADGVITIVYWDWYYARGGSGYQPGRTAWVGDEGPLWTAPTHWMPLPAPPGIAANVNKNGTLSPQDTNALDVNRTAEALGRTRLDVERLKETD